MQSGGAYPGSSPGLVPVSPGGNGISEAWALSANRLARQRHVRWRTDVSTDSCVRYGTSLSSLSSQTCSSTSVTDHVVQLSSLSSNTKYYYSIGTSAGSIAGDSTYFFLTAPVTGTAKATRIWALGDSGTADSGARAVRDAYLNFTGSRHTDLWLMLGDNAYPDSTDSDYQAAVFNMYPTVLRKSVLWPTFGNHEAHTASSSSQSGTYYDIFTLPKSGEAGGVASGTEAYYSFNYGNIHFVCLDSTDSNRSPSGAMLTWLKSDLAANTQQWLIAFWHHPPYSKGSSDSDTDSTLAQMRQYALPILEDYGVDLVLSGHSHSYERSYLLDRHYGKSNTLTSSMILDSGDGREDGSGAYEKPDVLTPHKGAVYTVAGSAGQTGGGSLNHPAMCISLDVRGSLVLDIDGSRLDAKFLSSTGVVQDDFTIVKEDSGTPPPTITSFTPTSGPVGTAVTLTGTNFVTGVTQVVFNGTSATSFTVDSATQIHATVPNGATTGKLSVTTTAGTGVSASAFTLTGSSTTTTTVEVRVAANADDAEEQAAGSVSLTSSDLELVEDGSNQTVGMRFLGLTIPPGATIKAAYLQFKVDETTSVTTSLAIQGQATDTAPTFTTAAHNISLRSKTTAAVPWTPLAWTTLDEAGPAQCTPDLSAVLQEIVTRPGWASGNSVVLIITGTGKRVAKAYDEDHAGAPLLHVEYSTSN